MKVAIGAKLKDCPAVRTVGLRCNWDDYTLHEQSLIREAERIYFPTVFYAGSFHAAGRSIYPSMQSYHHLGDKVRQFSLFRFMGVPIPFTRLFFGSYRRKRSAVLEYFTYPFVGKIPVGTGLGRGVFLIRDDAELSEYLASTGIAYIQEYIPMQRDLRVVILGKRAVHAYWKSSAPDNFRTNVAQGGSITFDDIPADAVKLALATATASGIDYAGFDLCQSDGRWLVLEANMNFGLEGFMRAGLSFKNMLCDMITSGEL